WPALKDAEAVHVRCQLRDNLCCACTGTNDSNFLACEVVGVIPFGGVEGLSLEAISSRQLSERRPAERPHCRDDRPRRDRLALPGSHPPKPSGFFDTRFSRLRVQQHPI